MGLNKQFILFFIAGIINTLTTYLVYIFLLSIIPYTYAYSITFGFGIIISYCLQVIFVFKVEFSFFKMLSFPLVYVPQYFLGLGVLYICVKVYLFEPWISGVIVIIVTLPITFILSRFVLSNKGFRGRSRC